jgi:hypothetical protein
VTLECERLTNWTVITDGQYARLGFEDEAGRPCAISLPIGLLSALMMTIPRILREALQAQFADGSRRMIHALGDWRVEQAVEADTAILSLATPDGFEVAFAVAAADAGRLGRLLRRFSELAATRTAVH